MENVLKGQSLQARRGFITADHIHTIISLTISQQLIHLDQSEEYQDKEETRISKVMIVDMAGNERQKKAAYSGYRLRDATKVGLSLSAFGNVIRALTDSKTTHIPYRDSKLTRLLQDSLGGNAITIVIGTITDLTEEDDKNEGENNLSTIRYLNRIKMIQNYPKPCIRQKQIGRFDT